MNKLKKCCKNCGFNCCACQAGYRNGERMCIAHDSLYGYGELIIDENMVCEEYEMDINEFIKRRGK